MSAKTAIVTIDGPSGVGKSTVSRIVASRLGYTYLDTGAMYRGIGLYIHRLGIDTSDEKEVSTRLTQVNLVLLPANSEDGDVGVLLNGEDVSSLIRSPEMSMVASAVSALPVVRHYLTHLQRELAVKGGFVAEGRDLGTVVFPQAAYKFFLDAQAEKRCQRRVSQLQKNGVDVDSDKILQMIIERDRNDSERSLAPLKKAADALLIDTTNLNVEQVCGVILASIEERSR